MYNKMKWAFMMTPITLQSIYDDDESITVYCSDLNRKLGYKKTFKIIADLSLCDQLNLGPLQKELLFHQDGAVSINTLVGFGMHSGTDFSWHFTDATTASTIMYHCLYVRRSGKDVAKLIAQKILKSKRDAMWIK